jgi:hypothetical protein
MANSKKSASNYEYAVVDTNVSGGYFTNQVNLREKIKRGVGKLFFSIRESSAEASAGTTSSVTVKLQFRCAGDAGWTDYIPLGAEDFVVGTCLILDDIGNGREWRSGVEDGGVTSGSVTFGFDW